MVGAEAKRGQSGAIRPWGETRARRPVRASALNFTTARPRRKAPGGAHVGRTVDKAIHVRRSSEAAPCGATGAHRAAMWGVGGAGELEAKERRSLYNGK